MDELIECDGTTTMITIKYCTQIGSHIWHFCSVSSSFYSPPQANSNAIEFEFCELWMVNSSETDTNVKFPKCNLANTKKAVPKIIIFIGNVLSRYVAHIFIERNKLLPFWLVLKLMRSRHALCKWKGNISEPTMTSVTSWITLFSVNTCGFVSIPFQNSFDKCHIFVWWECLKHLRFCSHFMVRVDSLTLSRSVSLSMCVCICVRITSTHLLSFPCKNMRDQINVGNA